MRPWLLSGCLLAGLLFLGQVPAPPDKVVFLDIGQGDSILLQSGTQQILIDGGPDATVLQRLAEELPWFDKKIDVVIGTHPDKDHIGGLLHVLERYDVGLVIIPAVPHDSQLYSAWLDHIKGVPYRFAAAGQKIELADATIEVLHPGFMQTYGKSTNNASVSTRVDFCPTRRAAFFRERIVRPFGMVPAGQKAELLGASRWTSENEFAGKGGEVRNEPCLSFLLTGDAEAPIERQLVGEYGSHLNVDILKAGHHGSKTSSTQEFLDTVSPEAVIISAGRNNQYGHPNPEVMERLNKYKIWRTDEQGSIHFIWNDGQWLAKPAPIDKSI